MPRILADLPSRALFLLLASALLSPAALRGLFCGEIEPGVPVPECRDRNNGDEVDCSDLNKVRLWPEGLRPGMPGERLPLERDSTQWRSFTIPGAGSGHELFQSLDLAGDFLYVAYNAGVQVWDISGSNAEDPNLRVDRDGWRGDFLSFPAPGENDFFTDDVAAAEAAGGNVVALSGKDGVGLTLWRHTVTPEELDLLYQDLGTDSRQVRAVEVGVPPNSTLYIFAAGPKGVFVYNASRALSLSRCLDQAGSGCPGVFLGRLGDMDIGRYLDIVERGGKIYVAASDGDPLPSRPLGLEIWEVSNPANPAGATRKFSGLATDTRGPTLFEYNNNFYLAAIERVGSDRVLGIFNVNGCLDSDGCATLGTPRWSTTLPSWPGSAQFLTYSESSGKPFLYYGLTAANMQGPAIEQLFDLSALGTTDQVVEFTASGGSYTDDCTGNTVDYWGDYYPRNGHGLRNISPQIGKFKGEYFYRAATGILDVHVRTSVEPSLTVSGPTAGFPGVDYQFTATAGGCTPDPAYVWTAVGGQIQGNGSTVLISWTTTGTKTVTVTNAGCPGALGEAMIEIQDPAPKISNLAVTPASPRVCETPVFTWDASGQPPIDYGFEIRDSADEIVFSDTGTDVTSFDWPTADSVPLPDPGSYTAVLNANNSAGQDNATLPFSLGEAALDFTADPSYDGAPGPQGMGELVQFSVATAGASSWTWDFGDGTSPVTFATRDQGESPTHTYSAVGTYTVTVTIENCIGASDTRQLTIEIIENPLAVLRFQAQGCVLGFCDFCVGDRVTFDQEFDGQPTRWEYDWDGDGTFEQSSTTGAVTIHTYNAVLLSFFPQIRISDGGGQEDTFTHGQALNVSVCAPPSITVSGPATRRINESGTFSASASNCSPAASGWTWSASGGAISGDATSSQVSISWSTGGTKTVTARNSSCGSAVGTRSVSVQQPRISVSGPISLEVNQSGLYAAAASGCSPAANGWTWTAPGATISGNVTSSQVSVSWSTTGSNTVTARNSACGSTAGVRSVVVTEPSVPLDADFTFSPPDPAPGQTVTFDAGVSTGNIGSYAWTFGDGSGSEIGEVVNHIFTEAGEFDVTLSIGEPGCGNPACFDDEIKTVVVSGPPKGETLVLPYFKVDTRDPLGSTTFFAVRNGADAAVTVGFDYFTDAEGEEPFWSEEVNVDPHQTLPRNLRTVLQEIPDAPVDPETGLATGYARVTVLDPILPERILGGDYFQVEELNDFASGSILLTEGVPDICSSWHVRVLNGEVPFDGGTVFTFYVPENPGDENPIVTGALYDEAGVLIDMVSLARTEFAFEVAFDELGFDLDFGAIEWSFRDGIRGHISAVFKARGRFSVGLPAVCLDAP